MTDDFDDELRSRPQPTWVKVLALLVLAGFIIGPLLALIAQIS